MLYGAIIGDIVGSIYEFRNLRSKKFPFFAENGFITDNSCMTIAGYDLIGSFETIPQGELKKGGFSLEF